MRFYQKALALLTSTVLIPCYAAVQIGPLMREEKVLGYTSGGSIQLDITDYARPPFYKGKMPLRYKAEKGLLGTMRLTHWLDYGAFRIDFSSKGERRVPGVGASIPGSARAVTSKGELLAQATVIGLKKGVGFEIEEIHYSNGTPSFRCRSVISFADIGNDGYKAQEVILYGRKTNDYFFLWPTGH